MENYHGEWDRRIHRRVWLQILASSVRETGSLRSVAECCGLPATQPPVQGSSNLPSSEAAQNPGTAH